jgi:hypothetical protein
MPGPTTTPTSDWKTDIETVARSPLTDVIHTDGGEYVPKTRLTTLETALTEAREDFARIVQIAGAPRDSMISASRQHMERGQAMMDVANGALDRIGR